MVFGFLRGLGNELAELWRGDGAEKSKNRLGVVSLAIAFLALLSTICLGFLQYRINQSLLDLTYMPAIALTYDPDQHRLNISNQGKANLFLCGTRTSFDQGVSFNSPRLIAAGTFFYIPSDDLEASILHAVGSTGMSQVPVEIYFEDAGEERWKADNLLIVTVKDGSFHMDTQTISITRVAWLRMGSINLVSTSRMPRLARIKDLIWPLPIGAVLFAVVVVAYIMRGKTKRNRPEVGGSAD